LADRVDFNIEDAFRIIDLGDKGYATLIELEDALRDLGV